MVSNSLPELITLNNYEGDWFPYLEAIYQYYMDEVVNGKLLYNNLPISCQFRPTHEGKGFAFWHAISEGEKEDDRKADLRRCERIRWIAWMIRNITDNTSNGITWWKNKRGPNTHTVLFLEEESYVVILAKRKDYHLFRTAYCANSRRKRQLIRERDEYWKAKKTKGAC